LAAAVRSDAAKLLVTILPELHEINARYPFTQEQQKIKDVLDASRVPVIDLIEGLRNHGPEASLWVTPADDHPNGKANGLIAAQILPFILGERSPLPSGSRRLASGAIRAKASPRPRQGRPCPAGDTR